MHVVAKTDDLQALYLSRAMLIYETPYSGQRAADAALVTVHDILSRPASEPGKPEHSAPVLGAGRLLSRSVLNDLLRSVSGLPQKREMLPPNVLFHDAGRMVWFVPSAVRPIWFGGHAKLAAVMNGEEVLHPTLLFVAEPKQMSVFALATNERPTADTPVFRAPYFNLYDSGLMCRGNVRLPDILSIGDIPKWEKGFFETQFTHSNYGSLAVTLWGGCIHDTLWKAMRYRQEWRGFPARALAPTKGLTVGKVVSK